MYWTYLRRELAGRKKQTIIVAAGLAVAVALVIIVNALAGGVRDAQAQALESVYGVGTDLTVTGAQPDPDAGGPGAGGGSSFEFGQDGGATGEDGGTSLSQSRLMTDMMRGTLDAVAVDEAAAVDGVAAATGALSLTNTTFSGELPAAPSGDAGGAPSGGGPGGGGGFGGGSFDIDSFTVLGVDPAASDSVGPLSAVELREGRLLDADDAGGAVAVLDETYAASAGLAVTDVIEVAGTEIEVVGIVASTGADADTAANVYLPLDVAQELAGVGDVVSTVYVQAASAADIGAVQSALEQALPDTTVSSQSDLAATVSGSLAGASALITNFGTWLSVVVLVVAVALAVLFTISGVHRRTREFGTLKAIGWSDRRVIGQVAGESVAQGLIGGVAGLLIGLVGVLVINLVQPTIAAGSAMSPQGGPGGMPGGMPGFGSTAQTASEITLSAPLSPWAVVAAIVLAVLGGLMAGAIGGWRAARLSPAEALRSVA